MTSGLHRVGDMLGRDPLPGPDQRVPGPLPHAGQVHGGDPVGHLPRAPQVVALRARRGFAGFLLPGLIARAGHQLAPASRRRVACSRLVAANRRSPRSSQRKCRQLASFSSPVLRPSAGVRSPAMPDELLPARSRRAQVRSPAPNPAACRACSQGSGPGKARPQQPQPAQVVVLPCASPAPMLTAAGAPLILVLVAQAWSRRRLPLHTSPSGNDRPHQPAMALRPGTHPIRRTRRLGVARSGPAF